MNGGSNSVVAFDALRAHAERLGRDVREYATGIGVDFGDGCDAFWALSDPALATFVVPNDSPTDVEAMLTLYDRLDQTRASAMGVLRHHIASKRARVDRRRNGNWGLTTEDGSQTSIEVGAGLTATVLELGDDVHAVLKRTLQHTWLGKAPSPRRVARLLTLPLPPEGERAIEHDDAPEPAPASAEIVQPSHRLRAQVTAMGMWTGLETLPDDATRDDFDRAMALPKGRIAQMLLALDELLPTVDVSHDLLKPGQLGLAFDDGRGAFPIHPRDRALARQIRSAGPQAAAQHIAEQYAQLNRARRRVLGAVFRVARERGYRLESTGGLSILVGGAQKLSMGVTHREVEFDPDAALTALLTETDPETAIRRTFESRPDFAADCVAALHETTGDDLPVAPPHGRLQPRQSAAAPPLVELDPARIARLDQLADAQLSAFWNDRDNLWRYSDAGLFDPTRDTWATTQQWAKLARQFVDESYCPALAILILREVGDPLAEALADRFMEQSESHDEVSDHDVTLVWHYRHRNPERARRWFVAEPGMQMQFAPLRARLGDPLALRFCSFEPDEQLVDPDEPADPHERALQWARTTHLWGPPDGDHLKTAIKHGWQDVAAALESNPFMLAGLLTIDRRRDQFDEPGALLAGEFFLHWSRLAPSQLLARLLSTIECTDLVGLATEAGRKSAAGRPEVMNSLPASIDIYKSWRAALDLPLAIAWRRCRDAGVV